MTVERKNESAEIIPTERRGLWIAVTFIIALLALFISIVAIYRLSIATAFTQGEVLILDNRIDKLEMKVK